jgi:hypothetical protein
MCDVTARDIVFVVRTLLNLGDYSNGTVLVLDSAVTELNTHRHNPKERGLHTLPLPGFIRFFDHPLRSLFSIPLRYQESITGYTIGHGHL